jgi:hypothetical protein
MTIKIKAIQIRIHLAAWERLKAESNHLLAEGRPASITRIVSDLILEHIKPNGDNPGDEVININGDATHFPTEVNLIAKS